MRSLLLSFACLAAVSAAAPLNGAQPPKAEDAGTPPAKTMADVAPMIRPFAVIEAPPLIRPGARRQLVRFGPFNMPAAKEGMGPGHSHGDKKVGSTGIMGGGSGITNLDPLPLLKGDVTLAIAEYLASSQDPEGFNVQHTISEGLCKECTVLAAKMDAVHENGTRADVSSGVYLHHVVAFNVAERKMPTDFVHQWLAFCPGGGSVQKVGENVLGATSTMFGKGTRSAIFGFGSVDEFKQMFTTRDGGFKSGFYFAKGDRLLLSAEMVNYRREVQQVYVQIDYEWVPGKPAKEAVTGLSSVTDCKDPMAFSGKGKSGKYVSAGTPVNKPGTILSMRGHMHDGGEMMRVFINDDLKCESKADYSTGYGGDVEANNNWTTISKMSECSGVWPVKKGDNVKLEAVFDEIAHPARKSDGQEQMEMGIMAFTFVQD